MADCNFSINNCTVTTNTSSLLVEQCSYSIFSTTWANCGDNPISTWILSCARQAIGLPCLYGGDSLRDMPLSGPVLQDCRMNGAPNCTVTVVTTNMSRPSQRAALYDGAWREAEGARPN
ncbi:hypothetical protein HK105_209507, partial [Polyrhizophydium stewartii]